MGGSKERQRIPRIGILSPVTESGMRDWWKALIKGLDDLGYVEGRNIEFVRRFADGRFERLPDLAVELASLEVDVIVPATPPAILAYLKWNPVASLYARHGFGIIGENEFHYFLTRPPSEA